MIEFINASKNWNKEKAVSIADQAVSSTLTHLNLDPNQFEVAIPDVNRFCKLTKEAMTQTQKTLGVKCELDCDYKVE